MLGLAVAIWAFDATGFENIIAIARRLGGGGFLLYCVYSLGVFVLLGGAWLAAAAQEGFERLRLFTWARMLREAASDLLPFSQLGGIVVSTRMLSAKGLANARVYASLIVDLATEMASQLIFTLFGVAIAASILMSDQAASLRTPVLVGGAIMVAIVAGFVLAPRWILPLAGRIAQHVLPGSVAATSEIGVELQTLYAQRRRVVLAFVLNLAAWLASAAGAWIVLRLMDVELSIWTALSIESLIFALRTAAFVIPAGIGVQEAGYALAAPLLGLPPESALALALAKRARDLAIAVPTLIIWQAVEARAVVLGSRRR